MDCDASTVPDTAVDTVFCSREQDAAAATTLSQFDIEPTPLSALDRIEQHDDPAHVLASVDNSAGVEEVCSFLSSLFATDVELQPSEAQETQSWCTPSIEGTHTDEPLPIHTNTDRSHGQRLHGTIGDSQSGQSVNGLSTDVQQLCSGDQLEHRNSPLRFRHLRMQTCHNSAQDVAQRQSIEVSPSLQTPPSSVSFSSTTTLVNPTAGHLDTSDPDHPFEMDSVADERLLELSSEVMLNGPTEAQSGRYVQASTSNVPSGSNASSIDCVPTSTPSAVLEEASHLMQPFEGCLRPDDSRNDIRLGASGSHRVHQAGATQRPTQTNSACPNTAPTLQQSTDVAPCPAPSDKSAMQQSSDEQWMIQYEKLVEYRQKHGHCLLQEEDNPDLSYWAKHQRIEYKHWQNNKASTMTDERQRKLDRLGFIWDPQEAVWETRFLQLIDYKRQNGHVNVPVSYKPNPQLGIWVKGQRKQYWKDVEKAPVSHVRAVRRRRYERLAELGFQWKIRALRRHIPNPNALGITSVSVDSL